MPDLGSMPELGPVFDDALKGLNERSQQAVEAELSPDQKSALGQGIPIDMVRQMALGNGLAAIRSPEGEIGVTSISDLPKAAEKGFRLVKQEDYQGRVKELQTGEEYKGRGLEAAGNEFARTYTAGLYDTAMKGALGGNAPEKFTDNPLLNPYIQRIRAQVAPGEEVRLEMQHALDVAKAQQVDTAYKEHAENLREQNSGSALVGGLAGVLTPGGAISRATNLAKGASKAIGGGRLLQAATRVGGEAALWSAEETAAHAQLADRPMMISSMVSDFGSNFLWNSIIGGGVAGGGALLKKVMGVGKKGTRAAEALLGDEVRLTPAEKLRAEAEAAQKASESLSQEARAGVAEAGTNEIRAGARLAQAERDALPQALEAFGEQAPMTSIPTPSKDMLGNKMFLNELVSRAKTEAADLLDPLPERLEGGILGGTGPKRRTLYSIETARKDAIRQAEESAGKPRSDISPEIAKSDTKPLPGAPAANPIEAPGVQPVPESPPKMRSDFFASSATTDDLASISKNKLGGFDIKRAKVLGSGNHGTAFADGSGKVLKLTREPAEAEAAKELFGRDPKHFIKIHAVNTEKIGDKRLYVIIEEQVQALSPEEESLFAQAFKDTRVGPNMIPFAKGDWGKFTNIVKDSAERSALQDAAFDPIEAKQLFDSYWADAQKGLGVLKNKFQLDKISQEAHELRLSFTDYKPSNIGKRGDKYVVLDVGGPERVVNYGEPAKNTIVTPGVAEDEKYLNELLSRGEGSVEKEVSPALRRVTGASRATESTNPGSAMAAARQAVNVEKRAMRSPYDGAVTEYLKAPSVDNLDGVIKVLKSSDDIAHDAFGARAGDTIKELETYRDVMRSLIERGEKLPTKQAIEEVSARARVTEANLQGAAARAYADAIEQFPGKHRVIADAATAYEAKPTGFTPPSDLAKKAGGALGYISGQGVGHAILPGLGGWAMGHFIGTQGRKLAQGLLEGNNRFARALISSVRGIGTSSKVVSKVGAASALQGAKGVAISSLFQPTSGQSMVEAAGEKANAIHEAAANPQALEDRVDQATYGLKLVDDTLASQARKWVVDTVSYLDRVAPKPPIGVTTTPFDSYKWVPSDSDATVFAHRLEAVVNPLALLEQVKKGMVLPETIETVEKVHPDVANQIKQEIMQHLGTVASLPYKQRVALSQFLDIPLETTLNHNFAQAMKDVWGAKPRTPPKQGGFAAPSNPQKMSSQFATRTAKFQ